MQSSRALRIASLVLFILSLPFWLALGFGLVMGALDSHGSINIPEFVIFVLLGVYLLYPFYSAAGFFFAFLKKDNRPILPWLIIFTAFVIWYTTLIFAPDIASF